MSKKELRHYQEKAYKAIFSDLDKGLNKLMVVIATGGGKSLLAAKIAKNFNRILFLCHTEELIAQNGAAMLAEFYPEMNLAALLEQHGDLLGYAKYLQSDGMFVASEREKFGIIKADLFSIQSKITIASYQTLHRRLDRIPENHFDLIIVDEAHMASNASISKALRYFQPKLLIGLTATPHRNDNLLLSDIFQKISYQYNIIDGINEGYLCELDAIRVKTKLNLDTVHTLGGEFNQRELRETVDIPERNQLLLDSYKKYADGKQNIIFCVDVEHAKNVHKVFTDAGELAEILVGDESITEDRKGVIQRFKSGETTHLINITIGGTGFDHPGVGCITLGRPSKSLTLIMQFLGRGTRTLPGVIDGLDDATLRKLAIKASNKQKCIVLDIVDNTTKHKLVNTWTLDKELPIEQRVFVTFENKQKLIDARDSRKFQAVTVKDEKISLFEIPTVAFSTSLRMSEPATDKQLAILKDKGYDVINVSYTKLMCSEIISNLPASPAMLYHLKSKNYDVSKPGITYGEYKLAQRDIEQREALAALKKQVDTNQSPMDGITF